MTTAWQRGLDVLKPSPRQLEYGLTLHHELPVCDGYGFLPRTFPDALGHTLHGFRDRGMGIVEYKRKQNAHCIIASTRDPDAASEFYAALDQAGLCGLVQNISDVGEVFEDAVSMMAAFRHVCHTHKDRIVQATCAEDLMEAKVTGKTGVIFSLTGLPIAGAASMADPDGLLDWVDNWYQIGVRFMHLGYNRRGYFSDGCTETNDGGLSDFGIELIRRMNKVGILVDVPHSSRKTLLAATQASAKPVVATHTGCAALHCHPRCKDDHEIKALAQSGGYIGIFAVPNLLGPRADLNLLLSHVQHAVRLVGADHVTIGTDIAHENGRPADLEHPAAKHNRDRVGGWKSEHQRHWSEEHLGGSLSWTNWPLITVGLVQLGLSEESIRKILGGNIRRVLQTCYPPDEMNPPVADEPSSFSKEPLTK